MRTIWNPLLLVAVMALPAASASGQAGARFLLSRTDGEQWMVQLVGIRGSGAARQLVVERLGQRQRLPVAEVLGLSGPTPNVQARVAVYLVGGDELKGKLLGGDKQGEFFQIQTPGLGNIQVSVDRLQCMVFRDRAPRAGASAFRIPKDARDREAVFQKARRGFDTILGELERFTMDGMFFVPTGAESSRLFRYGDLAGMALKDGIGPERPGNVLLISTSGDVLRVRPLKVAEGHLLAEIEGVDGKPIQLKVALQKISSLTFLGVGGRRFLSDMEPVRVAENGASDDLGKAPLFPYQKDRTASGGFVGSKRSRSDGFLALNGRTYGKGLGAHSKSVLTFRVPKGCSRFCGWVGIDDEVLALRVKGNVDVRVRMGDKVLFAAKGVRRGHKPRSLGVLPVTPGALLTLEVDFGKALFLGDRVDWIYPVFLR